MYGYKTSEHLVYGTHVVFYADHEHLVTFNKLKNPLGRIVRLFHQLVDVDYKIIHIDGHLNYQADYLSKAQCSCIYVAANMASLDSTLDW